MKRRILYLCVFLFPLVITAQENFFYGEYQLAYKYKFKSAEFKEWKGSAELRFKIPNEFQSYILTQEYNFIDKKSDAYINFKNFRMRSYIAGGGLYYVNKVESTDRFEIRLWQGTAFFVRIKSTSLKNFLRFEERFQKNLDSKDWGTAFRFRFRISSAISWDKHLLKFNKGMYLPWSIEAFANLKKADRYNDLVRITFGIGYKISPNWKIEADLSYKRTQDQSFNSDSNNLVLRLRAFNTFKKKTVEFLDKFDILDEID